jgi:zinc protease
VDHGIQLIIDELRRFIETPVTQEELADTISYLAGSLPLYLETNEGVARSLLNIERYNLGLDYLQRYATTIRSVTAEQILSASQRWIDLDHYALAIAEPLTETEAS